MHIDRRTAIKWVLVAGTAAQLPGFAFAAEEVRGAAPAGYGKDPNLLKSYAAGELWPLTMSEGQKRTTRVLCDLIIPADADSPAASAVAVPEFIDEWISAPYPENGQDRAVVVSGLLWLDEQAQRRYAKDFAAVSPEQASHICDEICNRPVVQAQFAQAAAFFEKFRALTALGFYTTPIGMKDLRYVGNEPLVKFNGPPAEVLRSVGLT